MEFLVFTFLAAAIAVGVVKVIRYAWKQDGHQRPSEHIRNPRERSRISTAFEDIVEHAKLRKPK